jgi:pyruvate/2-oxoglutarate dehydrogenase complex dihydrolipoamide acyltransferase (E2) component
MNSGSLNPTYERIRQTSVPITLVGESGRLVEWLKKPGDSVEKYEPLATIETTDGVETEVTAALSGVIKLLMFHAGTEIESGATLCYVQPSTIHKHPKAYVPPMGGPIQDVPKAPDAPVTRLIPQSPSVPIQEPPAPLKALTRRSTMGPLQEENTSPPIEELTMPESGTQGVEPRPQSATPKSQRRKTAHKTYHIESSQVTRLKRLALELQLAEQGTFDYNESELVRAAIELLLELPRPALIATLGVNREREKQGCYGSGWPRPGKF